MAFLKIRIDVVSKHYEGVGGHITFLVPTGESSEWIFERLEQCRDQVVLKDGWRKANMDFQLQCSLMTPEEYQVIKVNKRFGANVEIPLGVDVSVQNDLYDKVIYPLNSLSDRVEDLTSSRMRDDTLGV